TVTGLTTGWNKFTATMTANGSNGSGRFLLSTDKPGTIWFDVVSCFPPTYKNRPNGLRNDLLTMVNDLKPRFNRFPGGCFVEGDKMVNAFRWKNTIGPIETRPGHSNLWGYRTSDGMGFHEFLQMCEDTNSAPLYVCSVGMAHSDNVPMEPFIQEVLDAIEYANGATTTTWGAKRAANGHPEPFNLKYIEIGNEENFQQATYSARYQSFYNAIKAKYPNIICIADSNIPGSTIDYIDEHYYDTAQFFMNNATKYDKYSRTGPKIYVGEYAVTKNCGQGNLMAGLGEAAFMTGLERNSDVVKMASYAPLYVNSNDRKWNPDAIVYNSYQVYGTPSYHVQKMFSQNLGSNILPTTFSGSNTSFFFTTSKDNSTGDIILKAVNASANNEASNIKINGASYIDPTGTALVMTNTDPNAENSFSAPTKVAPVSKTVSGISSSFNYEFPAYSVTVLRIKTKASTPPSPRSALSQIEAEDYNDQSGIQTESCAEGGQDVGYIENGDYAVYNNINFGSGAGSFQARVASGTSGGNIEIRLDSITGSLVGTCPVTGTGDWQTWSTATCSVSGVSGTHNLYLEFTGGSGYLFNLNCWKFSAVQASPTLTPTLKPTSTPTSKPTIVNSVDINQDGVINMADVILLASKFNTVTGNPGYVDTYDLNKDGAINMSDVILVAAKFNTVVQS
ncbi:MAG: carbohydrate-binding protein, partial [Bacillota bacterium]|nr:carbohydrate-binding protein [Bacillota bacterium]